MTLPEKEVNRPPQIPLAGQSQAEPAPLAQPSHTRAEASATLGPPFEAYCRSLGEIRRIEPADHHLASYFKLAALNLFPLLHRHTGVTANLLSVNAIEEDGAQGRALGAVTEVVTNDTGLTVLPVSLARTHDASRVLRRFFEMPQVETFETAAGIVGTVKLLRSTVYVEPLFASQAVPEVFHHARMIEAQIAGETARDPNAAIVTFNTGSLMVSHLLEKVQASHQRGDPGALVEGPIELSSLFQLQPQLAAIVGVNRLVIGDGSSPHEVDLLTLDPRPLRGGSLPRNITEMPLLRKSYTLTLSIDDGRFSEPRVDSVYVEPYRYRAVG